MMEAETNDLNETADDTFNYLNLFDDGESVMSKSLNLSQEENVVLRDLNRKLFRKDREIDKLKAVVVDKQIEIDKLKLAEIDLQNALSKLLWQNRSSESHSSEVTSQLTEQIENWRKIFSVLEWNFRSIEARESALSSKCITLTHEYESAVAHLSWINRSLQRQTERSEIARIELEKTLSQLQWQNRSLESQFLKHNSQFINDIDNFRGIISALEWKCRSIEARESIDTAKYLKQICDYETQIAHLEWINRSMQKRLDKADFQRKSISIFVTAFKKVQNIFPVWMIISVAAVASVFMVFIQDEESDVE